MAAGTEDQESALRPLRNVASTTAALRSGELTEEEGRTAVIQVAAAVEMSLRRLLRDYPGAALQVRLRALAPDELRADEVLAEFRQHDQISIELAAAVHDLLEVRQQLRGGAPLSPQDAALAYQVADRLEQEANRPHPPIPPPGPAGEEFEEEASVLAATPPRRRRRLAGTPPKGQLALAGVVIVLLVALGVWWATPADSSELEEGITLFRMGAYEDAASHFWRYAQKNRDDPTPRLYLARIHRRLERPDLAAAQLDTALQLAPEDPDVFVELGFLLIDTGHPAEAVGRFRSALSLDPNSETAWVGLVTALREDGRPDAAERVVQTAPPALRPRLALPVDSSAAP